VSVSRIWVEAGDVSGGDPDAAGGGAGVVDLDEDEGGGPRGGVGVEVLDAVVGPPQADPHRDRFAAGVPLRDRTGVQDPLVARPPRRHITTRHHPTIAQVFERAECVESREQGLGEAVSLAGHLRLWRQEWADSAVAQFYADLAGAPRSRRRVWSRRHPDRGSSSAEASGSISLARLSAWAAASFSPGWVRRVS